MSIFRKSWSLKVTIKPLILVSDEYYYLLNFEDTQVKFLTICWDSSNYYPINKFEEDGWKYVKNYESFYQSEEISLSAYALYKFLVNSKFIYSLYEMRIICYSFDSKIEIDLNRMIAQLKSTSDKPINIKVKIEFIHHNIQIWELENDLRYIPYITSEHFSYNKVYDIVSNSNAYLNL